MIVVMTSIVPAGWYPDPASGERQRYFDGTDWSPWVFAATGMTLAPLADSGTPHPKGVDVTRVILNQAANDGVISWATLAALLQYIEQPTSSHPQGPTAAQQATPADATPAPDDRLWQGATQPPATAQPRDSSGPIFPAAVPRQSPARRWWHETRDAVKSDLAVHGLAYLGVLLLFAGVFGLVVWSFSDINAAIRPVAELAIPGALFAAAAMLNRRGTHVVAAALEVAGGLLLPIVTVASFVDGASVPPDPGGVGLTVGLAVATLAIAGGYALWARRHPSSALAYLVAPVVWLALGLLSLSWLDPVPSGEAVATPRATEVAVMTAAAGLTLLVARLRPAWPFAHATLTTGPTALGVLAVLAMLAGSNDGWAPTPAVVTAAGVVLGLEALSTRLPGPVLTITTAVSVGLGLLAARSGLDASPWVAVLAFGGAAGWADFHRRSSRGREGRSYAVAAAVLPLGVALGLVAGLGWSAGLLVTAAALLAGAFVARRVHSPDVFWTDWSTTAVGSVAAGVFAAASVDITWPAGASTDVLVGSWQPPVTCALLAGALLVAPPRRSSVLPWALVVLAAEAWAFAIPLMDAPSSLVIEGWAFGAAVLVLATEASPRRWSVRVPTALRAHLVLASLALGLLAWLVAAGTPSVSSATLAVVAASAAIAWSTVSVTEDLRGSAAVTAVAGRMTEHAADRARWVPPVVAAVAIVVAAVTAVDQFGWVTDDDWWPTVLVALALAFIALSRAHSALPRATRVSLETSLLLAVAAEVMALTSSTTSEAFGPRLVVLLAVLVVCAAAPRQLRDPRPAWLGWATSGALVLQLVDQWSGHVDLGSRALLLWGAAALLVGLTGERLPRASWARRLIRYPLPPVALGGLGLTVGAFATAATEGRTTTGWWFVVVAAVCAVAAGLSREGILVGVSAVALTVSYTALAPWNPVDTPWSLVAFGAVLVLTADLARALPWIHTLPRALSSLFWAGQIVIVAALPLVVDDDQRPLGLVLAGVVAMRIAVRMPRSGVRPWYAGVGVMLFLIGAGDAGPGWLALALAGLSVAATMVAAVGLGLSPRVRAGMRWLGALSAAAAWASFTDWAAWSDETTVIATALAAGLLAAASGVCAQLVPHSKPWVEACGGVALIATVAAALALPPLPREPAGQMVAGGLALVALGTALAAGPLGRSVLRIATTVFAASAVATFLYGMSATPLQVVLVSAMFAAVATVATAFVTATRRGTSWQPALLVAVLLSVAAVVLPSTAELPDTTLLTVALVVVAAQCMVVGRLIASTPLLIAGPPLLSVSWMLYASDALGGNPQWYLVPLGLALIVMAALLRAARRQAGRSVSGLDVVTLELAGVGFIAGPAMVQMATDSLAYVLLALAEGAAITLWAAVTKVRRRLAAGVAVVVASVVLLVAIPLTPLLPQWRGAALWAAVAALGLAAIVIATFIERGRAAVGAWVGSVSSTLSDWE